MAFNGFSAAGLDESIFKSLGDITDEMDLRIAPASYAFSIWGLIYTLMAIFVVYQALPDSWAESRNNELIFKEIG